MSRSFLSVAFILLVIRLFSCSEDKHSPIKENDLVAANNSRSTITFPLPGSSFETGDSVLITVEPVKNDAAVLIDSVRFFVDNKNLGTVREKAFSFLWESGEASVGTKNIITESYFSDGTMERNSLRLNLQSDIIPERYDYKIIQAYPHDPQAYTQGLVYMEGALYESTGLTGKSSLRKVDLTSGKVLQSFLLEDAYFAEGITIHDNKIIQLTWQSRVGFVYDLESFRRVQKFHYDTEGWGLTDNGEELIMSDGSSNLYFLDIQTFHEIKRLEVYDDKGPVINLNELEFIKEEIYANIYGSDNIIRIDPENGKVLGVINLSSLRDKKNLGSHIDVLNGIAFNPAKNTLLVTGKLWPKLFEIQVVPAAAPLP